jgi:RNA polymerase sigma-70 factor (ECF subfamily)
MKEAGAETLERLVQAALAGDRSAFSEIVRRLMKQVAALTYRITGDRETALDLAQDTFISAWENIHSWRGEAGFANWIFRIATNKSLNQLRTVSRHDTLDQLHMSEQEQLSPDPESLLNRKELAEQVRAFMATLPPQQRAIFELRFYKEMSFEEIAGAMERAVGTVKTGYREAVKKLRVYAQEKGWR